MLATLGQSIREWHFLFKSKARNPTDLDGGMNGIRSNYYKLLEKQN